jgi:hypothetical protein
MPPRKKPKASAYRLLITPHVNERTRRPTTLVVLETAQAFAAFRYELTVEETIREHSLQLKVLGLKAPPLNLPEPGRARFAREYENLSGTYEVTVTGLDGRASTCTVRIAPQRVELLNVPPGSAVQVATTAAGFGSAKHP